VPRWAGDVSFMTVLDEIRVIPEHVLDTFDRLHPVFNRDA
jgi:ATP adenylyltransferase